MIVIRDSSTVSAIDHPEISALITKRILDLSMQGFEISDVGKFLIVEPADTQESVERHLGVPLSAFELMDTNPKCYDLVYVLDQSGMGIELFVPISKSTNDKLLAVISQFAPKSEAQDGQ